MLIQEIIQEYDATDQTIRYRKQNYDYDTMLNRQERNSEKSKKSQDKDVKQGWYSGGMTNPRDPHEFVKKPHLTAKLDQDAYYTYVMEIRKLKQQGYQNPFFPQVYNVDITQDTKGNQRPRYRIEKLQSGYSDYPPEALEGLYERLFSDELQVDSSFNNRSYAIWYEISLQLRRAVQRSNYTNIRDDQLIEALMLIGKIIEEHEGWNEDLHVENIRIRGSRTGPQLVLMDPISDGGASIPDYDDVQKGTGTKLPPRPPNTEPE
jgi:hypothetical protein